MSKVATAVVGVLLFAAGHANAQVITNQPLIENIVGGQRCTPKGTWALPAGQTPAMILVEYGSLVNGNFVRDNVIAPPATIQLTANSPAAYSGAPITRVGGFAGKMMRVTLYRTGWFGHVAVYHADYVF
jgi:hypothetical protein